MKIVRTLKENDQDFEFYPTTDEIIKKMLSSIRNPGSFLDIGAGNGKVLKAAKEYRENENSVCHSVYAIEKSQILIQQLPDYVFVIGTDFLAQTLLDKEIGITFCNPPYSQFQEWALKILMESLSTEIFLVLPQRWIDSPRIKEAIELRGFKFSISGSYTFENSEDRAARAVVDLIHFYRNDRYEKDDPFVIWFDSYFNIKADKEKTYGSDKQEQAKESIKAELVKGRSLIPVLEELYQADLQHLLEVYKAFEQFDYELMKELNVDTRSVREGLQTKIKGLKNLYWRELFDNLDKITNRLCKKSRDNLLRTLMEHTSVDFTTDNAYAVIIWVLKNANKYFETQLLDLYDKFVTKENITNYKSNKRIIEDNLRYSWRSSVKDNYTHYKLEYRLIWNTGSCFSEYRWDRERWNGLDESAFNTINDICIVARNLGFNSWSTVRHFNWAPGKQNIFSYADGKTFMEVRAYKNGNIHIKFDLDFMQAFNVEAGRLKKWVNTPKEASEELDIPMDVTTRLFSSNLSLKASDIKLLGA